LRTNKSLVQTADIFVLVSKMSKYSNRDMSHHIHIQKVHTSEIVPSAERPEISPAHKFISTAVLRLLFLGLSIVMLDRTYLFPQKLPLYVYN
jgi:hypothetical protein